MTALPTVFTPEEIDIINSLTDSGPAPAILEWADDVPILPSLEDLERMDQEYRDGKIGNVYFLAAGDSGAVKVGYAGDIEARLASIQTGNHHAVTVLFSIAAVHYAEKVLHNVLMPQRIRGEWFRHGDEVEHLIECLRKLRSAEPKGIVKAIYEWATGYGRNEFGGR